MARLQPLRCCKFRRSLEQRSNGEMTESPQGSALAVTHHLKTTNASVCVDGCLTSVEKILSNEENSKDLKGRGRNLLMLILEKSWQK